MEPYCKKKYNLDHSSKSYRLACYKWFNKNDGDFLRFNNGDPEFFVPISQAFDNVVKLLIARRDYKKAKRDMIKDLAFLPIAVVSHIQKKFSKHKRLVGGKIQGLVISKSGDIKECP